MNIHDDLSLGDAIKLSEEITRLRKQLARERRAKSYWRCKYEKLTGKSDWKEKKQALNAKIIFLMEQGLNNSQIARELNTTRDKVRYIKRKITPG